MSNRLARHASAIVALTLAACTTSSATSPSHSPTSPSVTLGKVSAQTIELVWDKASQSRPEHYIVKRDGAVITTLPGTSTDYIDSNLAPASTYQYVVEAESGGTIASSKQITAKTLTPPLGAARLAGKYRVFYSVLASSLVNAHPGQPLGQYLWKFQPNCSKGQCGGKWRIILKGWNAKGTFMPLGASYAGGMKGQSLGWCRTRTNRDTKDSATLQVHVNRAATVSDQWIVKQFSGLFQEYFPAESGCSSSFLKAQVTGTLKG